MFKKIALYSMLFVLVTLSTAAIVVFLNKQPSKQKTSPIEISEEDMALTNLMNATMGLENYKANIKLVSTDKTVDLTGNFSVLDLQKNARADVVISGKAFGQNIKVEVKYKNDWIYATYNNFGIKIKAADLTDEEFLNEIIGLVSKFIDTDSSFDFNVDKIMEDLSGLKLEKTSTGRKISLSLTGLGDFVVVTDEDYLPLRIDAPAITFMGKTFNIYVEGQEGAASEVMVSEDEEYGYIDLSASKDLLVGIIKTIKQTPIKLNGVVSLFGQTLNVDLFVDSKTNLMGTVSLQSATNITLDVIVYDKVIYVNACGAKLVGSFDELIDLFGTYFNTDVDTLLESLSLGKTSMSIASADINFVLSNGYITSVSFEHAVANGLFTISNTLPANIKKPTGYASAISFTKAKQIIESYVNAVTSEKISFLANGSVSSVTFDLNGFASVQNNSLLGAYASGNVLGRQVSAWYKNQKAYVDFESNKVCFTTQFASEIVDKIISMVGVPIPEIDVDALAAQQVKSLSIDKDSTVTITLGCGIVIEARIKNNCKEIKVQGSFFDLDIDCTICLFDLTSKYERAYNTLRPAAFEDVSAYGNVVEAILDTLSNGSTKFTGSVNINILDLIYYNIGVEFELTRSGNNFGFKLKVTNLPTTCLITDTTVFKYSSQWLEMQYSNGNLYVKRYAKKVTKGNDLRFSKTYKLSSLTIDDVYDMIGLGGVFGKKIKDGINNAQTFGNQTDARKSINSLVNLSQIDNGILVGLQRSALPDALAKANVAIKVDKEGINAISANIATKDYIVIISVNLDIVK